MKDHKHIDLAMLPCHFIPDQFFRLFYHTPINYKVKFAAVSAFCMWFHKEQLRIVQKLDVVEFPLLFNSCSIQL